MIDGDNPVVQLCIAGMAVDGDPVAAQRLFQQAWDARRDAYDASVAAHYLARHQHSAQDSLHWNRIAVDQAEVVADGRANVLFASLYLNLGDSYLALGDLGEAAAAANRGIAALALLPPGEYRAFVAYGLQRLFGRIPSRDALTTDS